jgi:hypothetical protein
VQLLRCVRAGYSVVKVVVVCVVVVIEEIETEKGGRENGSKEEREID